MSSQTLRKLACFQKSVSKASACAMLSSLFRRLGRRLAKFVISHDQFARLYHQASAGVTVMRKLQAGCQFEFPFLLARPQPRGPQAFQPERPGECGLEIAENL
jgi:hypothetical protein